MSSLFSSSFYTQEIWGPEKLTFQGSELSGRTGTQTPADDSKAHAPGSLSTQRYKCISNSYIQLKLPISWDSIEKHMLLQPMKTLPVFKALLLSATI